MPVDLIQYRVSVRVFNKRSRILKIEYFNYSTHLCLINAFIDLKSHGFIYTFKLLLQVVLHYCFSFTKYIGKIPCVRSDLVYVYFYNLLSLHLVPQRQILSNYIESNPALKSQKRISI